MRTSKWVMCFVLSWCALGALQACSMDAPQPSQGVLHQAAIGDCSVSLQTSIASPQAVGTTITLTGSGSCINGTPEYKFYTKAPNGGWTILRDWSTSSQFVWNTTGLDVGFHLLQVWIRRQGETIVYEGASPTLSYELTGAGPGVCQTSSIATNLPSPQVGGAIVQFSFGGTCTTGASPEFKLWRNDPQVGWLVERDWSASATYDWNTLGSTTGVHGFQLWVRAQGSSNAYDSVSTKSFEIIAGAGVCDGISAAASPTGSQLLGSSVTWTMQGTCQNAAVPEFKVYRRKPNGTWVIARDWSTDATFVWDTKAVALGTHLFQIWVRAVGSNSTYQATTPGMSYEIKLQTVWANSFGGANNEYGFRVALDSDGNTYATGFFEGSITFGTTTLTSAGGFDVFILKFDTAGNILWAKSAGGVDTEIGYGIAVDKSANVYITGYYKGTATFGTDVLSSQGGSFDVFLTKLDKDGNFLYTKTYGDANSDYGIGISLDGNDNPYIAGYFYGGITIGTTTLASKGVFDIYVAKLDPAGNVSWVSSGGGTSTDIIYELTVDKSGNCHIVGAFAGTSDFGTSQVTSAGGYDVLFAKLDASGNWLWAKSAGGSSDDVGNGIAIDGSGKIYATGYFESTATFGTKQLTSAGGIDIFLVKLDGDGEFKWTRSVGSSGSENSYDIAVDDSGKPYITGYFQGTVDFGGIQASSKGGDDAFAAKLDSDGNFLWVRTAGGTGADSGFGITVDASGNAYIIGYFQGTGTFGPTTLNAQGGSDVFVWKPVVPTETWATFAGGSLSDSGYSITVDDSGSAYLTGSFQGVVSFGSTILTSKGDFDIFVVRLDSNGNFMWAKSFGGTGTDIGNKIKVDSNGNVYVIGYFEGNVTFGLDTLQSTGSSDVFVAKLDANGQSQWAVKAGGTGTDIGRSVVLSSSDVYIVGSFAGTSSFGSTQLTSTGGGFDIFVARLSQSDGSFSWAVRAGGSGADTGYGVAFYNNNVYITGVFEGGADFGTTNLASAGGDDLFVASLASASGSFSWAVRGGGTSDEFGADIAADATGVYIAGVFQGSATFGATNLTAAGGNDILVTKLNASGTFQWAKAYGGAGHDFGLGIALSSDGSPHITGAFSGTLTLGSLNATSKGASDIFAAKLDVNGQPQWLRAAGGAGSDYAIGIDIDSQGFAYTVGYFQGTADFGAFSLTSAGGFDMFGWKPLSPQ